MLVVAVIGVLASGVACAQSCPLQGQVVRTDGQRECITNLSFANAVVTGYGRTVSEMVLQRSLSRQPNYAVAISKSGSCSAVGISFLNNTGSLGSVAADLPRRALASCTRTGCECELAVHIDRVQLRRVEPGAAPIQAAEQPQQVAAGAGSPRTSPSTSTATAATVAAPPAAATLQMPAPTPMAPNTTAANSSRTPEQPRPETTAANAPLAESVGQMKAAATAAESERTRFLEDKRRSDEQSARTSDELAKMKQQLASTEKALSEARAAEEARQKVVAIPKSLHRKALVIGNENYQQIRKLETAAADAREVSKALKTVGFDVTLYTDLDSRAMRAAAREFKARIQSGDEVIFFFAGHGVQISGSNYLLPVSVRGENEDEVRDEAILLQRILDDTQDKNAGFTLAIVDACRNNPFRSAGRAIGGARGLVPTSAATGQMIIFSAGAGQEALDKLSPTDKDPNGVFTRVFVREMLASAVSVDKLLRSVRNEVVKLARSVGQEQTPALYDQTLGEFYFRR